MALRHRIEFEIGEWPVNQAARPASGLPEEEITYQDGKSANGREEAPRRGFNMRRSAVLVVAFALVLGFVAGTAYTQGPPDWNKGTTDQKIKRLSIFSRGSGP
jgi:hypothetical protein